MWSEPDGVSRLGARHGELTDGHNAIGAARHDCRIVCAKPINRCEAARSQVEVEFVSQPAAHDERVVVRAFLLAIVKRVAFGDEEAPVLRIQLRDTRERQLSMLSTDAPSEERFASLAESRWLPFSDIKNQHPRRSKSPREGNEYVVSVGIGDKIIENAPAKNRVVATGWQVRMFPTLNEAEPGHVPAARLASARSSGDTSEKKGWWTDRNRTGCVERQRKRRSG